jgi:hypothetical protein
MNDKKELTREEKQQRIIELLEKLGIIPTEEEAIAAQELRSRRADKYYSNKN